jgi:hypothetical protein
MTVDCGRGPERQQAMQREWFIDSEGKSVRFPSVTGSQRNTYSWVRNSVTPDAVLGDITTLSPPTGWAMTVMCPEPYPHLRSVFGDSMVVAGKW